VLVGRQNLGTSSRRGSNPGYLRIRRGSSVDGAVRSMNLLRYLRSGGLYLGALRTAPFAGLLLSPPVSTATRFGVGSGQHGVASRAGLALLAGPRLSNVYFLFCFYPCMLDLEIFGFMIFLSFLATWSFVCAAVDLHFLFSSFL
jgi:hypothetical protein